MSEPFKTRGVMFDPARMMERPSYYRGLLPWLARWGYNLLQLHLTDDEGCALVFPSRPELASCHAFSAGEMRELVAEARGYGIEVVPEIETLGHTRFITGHRRYRHLGGALGRGFAAIDPDHPETREVLADLLRDTAEIFDSELIHVGLDEVNLSVLPRYEELPPSEHWRVFARHARWVHDQVRDLGCRPAMWTDHVLRAPQLAAEFDPDVLMVDWHYTTPLQESSLEYFGRSPFEFWGAPATICWMSCVSPNPVNIGNLREFSARALRFRGRGLAGMLNTVWCPWRNLTGAIDLALGLGGHLFSTERESPDYPRRFARDFYGLSARDAERCGATILRLYMHAPDHFHHARVIAGSDGVNRFSREDVRLGAIHHERMTRIAETLEPLVGSARRNAERLGDVVLTARALAAIGRFATAGRQKGRVRGRAGLVRAVEEAWDRDRHLDDARLRPFRRTPGHYLRGWMLHGLRNL